MSEPKHDGRRISETGGGAERSGSSGGDLGKQQKLEYDRNPEVDPRLRVMKRFRDFFSDQNRYVIMCPKGVDGREVYIKFHSKLTCTRVCSCSHASLRGPI